MTSPTTPRDAIGLSERLRDAKRRWVPIMASHPAFADAALLMTMDEAATQLDALRSEINEWANEVARYKAYAEKFDQENTELRARVKELEATDRYANLISIIADIREKSGLGGKPMLSELADAVWAKIASAESRATRAEQERDEAYERLKPLARDFEMNDCDDRADDDAMEVSIKDLRAARDCVRRLTSGPDKEKRE